MKGKEPLPGTPDEVISVRFDRKVREEYVKLGLEVPVEFQ